MAYQSIEDVPSRYELVHVISRRARKIQGGARPIIQSASRKPTRIAQQEAMAGVLEFTKPGSEPPASEKTDSLEG